MTKQYSRGSEWRKWDLHLHAPSSALNNQFEGSTLEEKWDRYIAKIETLENTPVLGITDYFSVNGYQEALRWKQAGRLPNIDLILPNVELRIMPVTQADRPINLHFIFSPDIVDALESIFFQGLEYRYGDNAYRCTRNDLIRLGRDFLGETGNDEVLYKAGVNQFKVSLDSLKRTLEINKTLSEKSVIAVSNSNQDGNSGIQEEGMEATRQDIYRLAHLVLSGNPRCAEYFLGKGVDTPKTIIAKCGSIKPCVIGSDAHSLEKIGAPDLDRFTWVKADPTFEGLLQVLNEPGERVYIGLKPPALSVQASRPTRIMHEVRIRRAATAKTEEVWFNNVSIPLNPELIAVIGNKGSGKSALADILGLTGNSSRHDVFSFLHKDRFRDKANRAKQFEASLVWASGEPEHWIPLDQNPPANAVERVKYIPQQYLEMICADVMLGRRSPFYAELEEVIFSHVPKPNRLGHATLRSLLEHRGKETNEAIGQLVAELLDLNAKITVFEDQYTEKNRAFIVNLLNQKNTELDAHNKNKPPTISPPAVPTTGNSSVETVKQKRIEVTNLDKEVQTTQAAVASHVQDLSRIERLITKLENLKRQVEATSRDMISDLQALGISLPDVLSTSISKSKLEEKRVKLERSKAELDKKLDDGIKTSPAGRRKVAIEEIRKLEATLDAPQKQYQAFLDATKRWEESKEGIEGNESSPGTISYLKKQISEINEIPSKLKGLCKARDRKMLEIFREKSKLRGYYQSYYGAVRTFLDKHELNEKGMLRMNFNVAISDTGFCARFLSMINQRKTGSFSTTEDGSNKIKKLVEETHFTSPRETLRFVRLVNTQLHRYQGKEVSIQDQLRQESSLKELYNLLFSLDYLEPQYSLQWDDKGLEQLSPGERGNLLLIFFLLVDLDDRPLIIDQPEENLDNQTVFRTLVPCIKNAKVRRQIILVTHNPNLAVVCDAEQVIYSNIHKLEKNRVEYVCGALENSTINRHVIDVLEGTRPAFDRRDVTYQS